MSQLGAGSLGRSLIKRKSKIGMVTVKENFDKAAKALARAGYEIV